MLIPSFDTVCSRVPDWRPNPSACVSASSGERDGAMRQIKQGAKWTHGHIVVVHDSDIKFERFDLIYSLLF